MALPTRTGTQPAGAQTARLIECKKSKYHGFHPENEECSSCEPPKPAAATPDLGYYTWLHRQCLAWYRPLRVLDTELARRAHGTGNQDDLEALRQTAKRTVPIHPKEHPEEYDLDAYLAKKLKAHDSGCSLYTAIGSDLDVWARAVGTLRGVYETDESLRARCLKELGLTT